MNYFNFPREWINSRNIPKEALYKAMDADEKLKKLFIDNVERIRLEYLVTPQNSNIEAYINDKERYDEVQFYSIKFRKKGAEDRIAKLLHGVIPKSTVIEVRSNDGWMLSTAIKSIGNSSLKIEAMENTGWIENSMEREFIKSMDSSNYNTMNQKTFYGSIVDRIKAYRASQAIGEFTLDNVEENAERADKILAIQEEMNLLKKELNKEKHTFKRAEIVKKIKRFNEELQKLG